VPEDWAAVAKAINERVTELGWRQRELAERSHVSPAVVREIQRHTVERRRSPRTLESLSVALGWHPQHLDAVLNDRPVPIKEPADVSGEMLLSRLDAVEQRLAQMTRLLNDLKTNVNTVLEHVRRRR
jgi:transcriptional regulator with XRE-family HTH domain